MVQPSLFDTDDTTDRTEAQIEPFAPGIWPRHSRWHTMSPEQFEAHNANLIGSDIGGGAVNLHVRSLCDARGFGLSRAKSIQVIKVL